jgi:GTP-binding protein
MARVSITLHLPVIVIVNKIDKPAARPDWAVDKVFDLMASLNAPDDILDFPVVYASAKNGTATVNLDQPNNDISPILDQVITSIPAPEGDETAPLQLLISAISYSQFMGQLGIGKITAGSLKINQPIAIALDGEIIEKSRLTKLFMFDTNTQKEVTEATVGDIVAIAGLEEIRVGQTITDPENPVFLEGITIDPPTISVNIIPNDSPFAGKEGDFVTSTQIRNRLQKELLTDVALHIEELTTETGFKVSGRGELHLSILIEKMRREGYEFQVSRPTVLYQEKEGQRLEPYEKLTIDVSDDFSGKVIETLGVRKGQLIEMTQDGNRTRIIYKIPTRGLLGYQSEFMTITKGLGVMNYVFDEYGPYSGDIKSRKNGVLIANEPCNTIAFALFNLQERGQLFMGPGEYVYEGQIIGEHSRDNDLVVNPGKGKKLTNMRASGSDESVVLTPPTRMSLEQIISYITNDELVEITPKSIRIRKRLLKESDRKRAKQL